MNELKQQSGTADVRSIWQNRDAAAADWLTRLQEQAVTEFEARGFPDRRLEDWRYTNVEELAEHYLPWLQNDATDASRGPELLPLEQAIQLVFVNGAFRPDQSCTNLPAGVHAGSLAALTTALPELEQRLGTLAQAAHSGFVALNTAFAGELVAIVLPDDCVIEQPVYISYAATADEIVVQPRVLVVAGRHSQVTVIEHHHSNAAAVVNAVTELHCGPGSRVTWHKLQEEHPAAWHMAVQQAYVEEHASIFTTQIDSGSALARNELLIKLAGEAAHAECKGLLIGSGTRHTDSRITVEHAAPHTTSRERYRGVLADRSRGVFNGRILVQPEAQKTSAELTNRNLLLDKGAEINTKPELEIYADDVKCAHGSTTGQLDKNALFYLLARGIDEATARQMLVRAFAAELLADIELSALSERAQAALRLGGDHG